MVQMSQKTSKLTIRVEIKRAIIKTKLHKLEMKKTRKLLGFKW
jgi:hypothetical protein